MIIFKNRWFSRWAQRENVTDAVLRVAAMEILAGNVDADLGGCLFKKRLSRAGSGKSGGYRTIVGYRKAGLNRVIFLYAFPKNARANISDKETAALSIAAKSFLAATDQQISELLTNGAIMEIHNE